MIKKLLIFAVILSIVGGVAWVYFVTLPRMKYALENMINYSDKIAIELCEQDNDLCRKAITDHFAECIAESNTKFKFTLSEIAEFRKKYLSEVEKAYLCAGKKGGATMPDFWVQMIKKAKEEGRL
jgi:uncharacterized protein YqcC (DUF446 family)